MQGDYRRLVNHHMLDSATNYECYKGLYSSLESANYHEIAYALNRQFGEGGLYRDIPLYNFVDNHDVNRVASNLKKPAHLYPLYLLLFTMPGAPSIYYGSEWGLEARRTFHSDRALRPQLDLSRMAGQTAHPRLAGDIARLASLRASLPALRHGDYRQLSVAPQQFAFARFTAQEHVVVLLNAAEAPVGMEVKVPANFSAAVDLLDGDERFTLQQGRLKVEQVPACWGRVLKLA